MQNVFELVQKLHQFIDRVHSRIFQFVCAGLGDLVDDITTNPIKSRDISSSNSRSFKNQVINPEFLSDFMNRTQHCIQDTSSCPPLRCRDLWEARDFLTILLPHSQGILDTRWRSGKILGHQLSHTFHTDTRRTSRKGSSASGGIGRT